MISVCMATYNGERFIGEQIDSVLQNLTDDDELIISDDGSNDKTVDIVKKYTYEDNRIQLIDGPRKGVIANLENAIIHSKGDFIFLCDQDDIWSEKKCEVVKYEFEQSGAILVVHDAVIVDQRKNILFPSFFSWRESSTGLVNNFIKNSYIGCCMAFKRDLLPMVLPIPLDVPMHDQWIGLCGEIMGKISFINDSLILYRRYDGNVSNLNRSSVKKMACNRFKLMLVFITRIIRNMFIDDYVYEKWWIR